MRKFIAFLFIISLLKPSYSQKLIILHTNDIHSHLNGLAPEREYTPLVHDNDPTLGGLARIAGFIGQQKATYGDSLLVLDAGDFLMGSLFQTLENKDGFQLGLMKTMGYDYISLGNHEFDFGTAGLAGIIKRSKTNGPIPQILCSNFKPCETGRDSALLALFNDSTILPYSVIGKNGIRIGLFALVGLDATESIPSQHQVSFENKIKTAKKTACYLKNKEKTDIVIVLSHSGLVKDKKEKWTGEDVELGKKVPEIDLILSGHKHPYLVTSLKAGNATIAKTEMMGSHVGRIEVEFDRNKKPLIKSEMVAMDDKIPAKKEIQDLIDQKAGQIERDLLSPFNIRFNDPVFETSFSLIKYEPKPTESNLGPLVADAIYLYLNKRLPDRVDVAFIASGVVRNNIEKGHTGQQNISDIFNVVPLGMGFDELPGTPVGKLYVTAHELKLVSELILAVYHSKLEYYLFFSGMRLSVDHEKGLFRKIKKMEFLQADGSYQEADMSRREKQLYCIAANQYMIGFIAGLKKMSKGIVKVIPKDKHGNKVQAQECIIDVDLDSEGIQEGKEWIALLEWVRSFPDTNGNGIPDVPEEYKEKRNPIIIK